MRKFATSLLALFISGLAGGLVAQALAVATGAGEEFILVFMAVPLIVIIATILFFAAQFFARPVRAVDRLALGLVATLIVVFVALVGWTLSVPAEHSALASDLSVMAGLTLPGVAVVLVQWLFVRWRLHGTKDFAGTGAIA